MNREDLRLSEGENPETIEPELRQALANFKSSVHAWSDEMMSRPREAKAPARTNWSLITKWALACVVFAGTVSGGVYQSYRQQEAAKAEAARIAAQQRELAAQRLRENEEDIMAKVDNDVAQEVPRALDPLESMMNEDQNTGN
jgi:hypothetical protein